MSGIAASVKLDDQMTPTLKRIDKHLDKIISALTKLEGVVNKTMTKMSRAVNTTTLNQEKLTREVLKTQKQEELLAKAKINTQIQSEKLNQQQLRTQQMINRANQSQQRFNQSMRNGIPIASSLGNAIKVGLASYLGVQGVSKAIGLADNLQMTTNRLDLLTGGKQTEELKNKIYESAMRSRADYLGTADSIAKMGLRTGDTFKSMDELIAFNETLNKMYAIAGTGAHEQFGATLQLIQALGSGVLRGQEFNAVFEAAPNVLQAVAKHMDVPVEKLREMAEEGAITSTILKNAMFEAAKDTNEQFKKLKYTFGHVFTGLKNSAIHSFEPVLKQISNITSSERWIKFIDGIGIAIDKLAKFSSKALDFIGAIVNTVIDGWDLIEPILIGLTTAYLPTIIGLLWAKVTALWAAASAWLALNWHILLIGVAIGIVIWFAKKMGVTFSKVCGVICGVFAWLGAAIGNVFIVLYNTFIDIINSIVNGCIKAAEIVYNAFNGGFTGWINGVQAKLWEFVNGALQLIKPLISAWDKIKGTNYSAELQMKVDERIFDNKVGSKSTYKKFDGYDSFKKEHSANYINMNKAWEKGYNFGANLTSGLSLDELGKTISGVTNGVGSDVGKYLKGGFADNPALDDILKNTKDIANNTSVDTDKEDLSYMRDMAARDAINRHTTRNVKIEMVNNNNVSGDMDLNTILQQIAKTVNDAVNVNASGIHY